jgi:hypothetical protein
MRKFNQILAIGIIVLGSTTISQAQNISPILANKLDAPEPFVKQSLQKRALTWIDGQWKIENDKYIWVSGNWAKKKIGYVFINGEWEKSSKGWTWKEGYWKQVSMNTWMNLYA